MKTEENIIFQNEFGSITNKRVVIKYKKGEESISLKNISSISFNHERNMLTAIISFAFGLASLYAIVKFDEAILFIIFTLIGIFLLLSGFANIMGHHNIILSVDGKDRKPIKVEMAKTKQGKAFVNAIKKEIF